MSKKIFKLKRVAFQNNLLPNHPTQFKVAMVTPVVVNRDKFVENVVDHTGLHRAQVVAVLDAIEDCAGDYMELGNAVQLGENLGTIKPTIRVKAFNSKDDCKASSVLGVGIRFIPTGRLRTRLADVGFSVVGESDGSDVDDPDIIPTPDPDPEPEQVTVSFQISEADGGVVKVGERTYRNGDTAQFPIGRQVTFLAVANPTYTFGGWNGASGSDTSLTMTIEGATTIQARFNA